MNNTIKAETERKQLKDEIEIMWSFLNTGLLFLMIIGIIALMYGGSQKRNRLHIVTLILSAISVSFIAWLLIGQGLTSGASNPFIGAFQDLLLIQTFKSFKAQTLAWLRCGDPKLFRYLHFEQTTFQCISKASLLS